MAPSEYRFYVVDSSIKGELRESVMQAIRRSAPAGSKYLLATSFKNLTDTLNTLSKPDKIRTLGRIGDMTIIAHGSYAGAFHIGQDVVGHQEWDTIRQPVSAFAERAKVDVIRCTHLGRSISSTAEDRRSLYRKIALRLLPGGGRVSGCKSDVEFSTGGGVRLTEPVGFDHMAVGGAYPKGFHSLELLKKKPQETVEITQHKVRYGDRIWYLAPDYGYGNKKKFTEEVNALNPGLDFRKLKPGQSIFVPSRVGVPSKLSTPYALRQRQAMRSTSEQTPLKGVSTFDRLRRQLEATPAPPAGQQRFTAAPTPTFSMMDTLRRLEKQGREQEQMRQRMQRTREQWNRRPSPGLSTHSATSGIGTLGQRPKSTLRLLDDHLRRTWDSSRPYQPPSFDTITALGRLEEQARDQQRTRQWLKGVQQQLNRRPGVSTGFGATQPSTLEVLKRHLNKF